MPKRQVFYSFHYELDSWRAGQVRNIGVIEGNTPVSDNAWEEVKRKGESAIKRWIDENMNYRSCVVVLVGQETASRKWVQYEIQKAWNDGKGLLGIYIHNIKDQDTKTCAQGSNPFDKIFLNDGRELSSIVKCYNPRESDAYNDIRNNLEKWVEAAISQRQQ